MQPDFRRRDDREKWIAISRFLALYIFNFVGTVAWKIGNTGKMVVVMYSVPYSHDFHSNWCGAGIFDVGSTNHLFDIMYYKNRTDFTRKEFWSDLGRL